MVSNWLAEDRLQEKAEKEIATRLLLDKMRKDKLKQLQKENEEENHKS